MFAKNQPLQIARILAGAQMDLQTAQAARAELLADLAKGKDVSKDLDEVDSVIAIAERQIKRIEDAKRVQATANSTEARKERHEGIVDGLKDVTKKAAGIGEQARQLCLDVAGLSGKLTKLEESRREVIDLVFAAVADAAPNDVDDRIGLNQTAAKIIDNLALPGYFTGELWRARLGEVGVHTQSHWINISAVRPDGDPEEEIKRQLNGLQHVVDKIVDASERANLNLSEEK